MSEWDPTAGCWDRLSRRSRLTSHISSASSGTVGSGGLSFVWLIWLRYEKRASSSHQLVLWYVCGGRQRREGVTALTQGSDSRLRRKQSTHTRFELTWFIKQFTWTTQGHVKNLMQSRCCWKPNKANQTESEKRFNQVRWSSSYRWPHLFLDSSWKTENKQNVYSSPVRAPPCPGNWSTSSNTTCSSTQ